jgi:two-component system, chemotaxis family, protein-glutamate methylesterase/glutaminase
VIRLLIVEDSALMRKLLGRIFADEGDFEVAVARDGIEALAVIATFKPDVVTLDIHMPGLDGLACLDRIMLDHPCPVVMVSALTEEGAEETLAALDIGAVDFVAKPGGAISLDIDRLAPLLVEKVRNAATVRVRRSHRLLDRLRGGPRQPPLERSLKPPMPRLKMRPAARPAGDIHPAKTEVEGIVLIGTSTGGPPALDAVLSLLPVHFPWPVIVAQHMPASFTGPLSRRLNAICALEVQEVVAQTRIAAGNIYIAKGDADIIVASRAGQLVCLPTPSDPDRLWHPSIERLVRSAAALVPADNLVAVLMTGMGNDGAPAMAELKQAGGRTIAEAEETAVVWGMPGALVKLNGASVVAPLERIAETLMEMVP